MVLENVSNIGNRIGLLLNYYRLALNVVGIVTVNCGIGNKNFLSYEVAINVD